MAISGGGRRARTLCLAVAATCAAATVPVAPAVADPADTGFIDTLRSQAIPYLSEENAIAVAAAVCAYVRAGQSPDQLAVEVESPSGWNRAQSDAFVRAATQAYCPG